MNGMSRSVGRMGMIIGGGLAVLTGLAVKLAGDYQKSLNIFQSVTRATVPEMEKVDSLAKALGADLSLPATSAKDAADAMTELAKGGLSVAESMAAARGVLQMSAAAEISNADAAKIAARALGMFNMEGKDAGKVADVLANAANASTGEMSDFALGLQQSGAVAKMYGLTINDTTAALMEMADAGIAGSDAGTSLKQLLMSLIPVTAKQKEAVKDLKINLFDAKGEFIGIKGAIKQYHDALAPLPAKQRMVAMSTIFGSDAIRAANIVLLGGVEAYDAYLSRTTVTGAAADLAAAKMKGFNGALEGFKSAAETAAITVGTQFLPALTSMIGGLSSVVGFLERHKTVMLALMTATGSLAMGMVSFSIGTRVATVALMMFGSTASTATASTVGLGVAMRATGIGAVVGLIGMAVGALGGLAFGMRAGAGATDALTLSMRSYKQALDDARTSETLFAQGKLSLQSAELGVKEAMQRKNEVLKESGKGSLEYQRAVLGVKQANLLVKQSEDQIIDSAKRAATAHATTSRELAGMIPKISTLSERLGFLVSKGITPSENAAKLFATSMRKLSTDAGGSTTAAGRAALEVAKLTDRMKRVPKPEEIKAAGIFQNITKEAQKETKKTTKVLDDLAPQAGASASKVGGSVKSGVIAGVGGLGAALAAKITAEINQALAQAAKDQGAKSPAKKWIDGLGRPLGEGVVMGFLLGVKDLPTDVSTAVRTALEKGQTAVSKAQDKFRTAFDRLAEYAMRAFDSATDKMVARLKVKVKTAFGSFTYGEGDLTPAEKQLAALDEMERQRQLEQEMRDALASGDAARIAAAKLAIERDRLEKQATIEREAAEKALATGQANLEERRRRQRVALETELADLKTYLSEHPKEWKKTQDKVLKLLKGYGVNMHAAGVNLGREFAKGLLEAEADVRAAAKRLADAAASAASAASGGSGGGGGGSNTSPKLRPAGPAGAFLPTSSAPTIIESHSHIYLDARQIAESVTREQIANSRRSGAIFTSAAGVTV